MKEKLRKSGIDIIGDVPWGTHFCQFYQTKEDLINILVPYFKAGLENNEFCMWITSQPLDAEEAKEALRKAVPDFDYYLDKGQIEIIPYNYWYVIEEIFDSQRILNGWVEKLNKALADDYDGLRLSGNTFWLEKEDWDNFVDYEEEVDSIIGNYKMIALCTYSLDRCSSTEIIDVVINHQFALIKKEGKWEQIESSRRKQADEALQESEERFRTMVNAIPQLAWIARPDGYIYWYNERWYAYTGTTPEQMEGWGWQSVHDPAVLPKVLEQWRASIATGQIFDMEFPLRGADGLFRPFLTRVLPLKDAEGHILQWFGTNTDITERKEAEDALIKSEERFRTLAENSPDVIARFDRQNRHLYANPAATLPYGHSQEEIIGKKNSELGMNPEQVKFWERHYENVFATGKPETIEFQYTSPQGKEYYFNTRIVPEFADGEVTSVLAISRDITDIKKAEAKLKETLDNLEEIVKERTAELEKSYNSLKESERSLAEAQKMAHIGNWKWNIVTNELHWSDEVYHIFGLCPQEFSATFDAYFNYVHPDDRDYLINAVKEALKGESYSIDNRIITANGEERIVHAEAEITFNEDNIPVYARGMVQDITEHKKAEKALKLANAYNRSLIEASVDPLVTVGLDGKITDVNNSTEFVTGYSRKELIGTDFSDYFTESEKAREGYQHVFRKGLIRDYPLEIRNKNGYITPVLYNASVYKDESGEITGVFAAARDITELKKAEEKIQILANAVESSDDAVITKSLDGIITSWNKGAEQIYGYFAEEIIGKNVSIIEPDNLKGEIKQLTKKIKEGERVQHYETLRMKKDGTIINVSVTLSPVFDASGKLVAISTIARDITERKKAEEALRLSNIYNRSLIEASLDPLVTIGPDGKITDVNGATELVTGYSRNELTGTDFSDYFTEPEKARTGYQQVFIHGEVRDYPLEIRHKDGHITPVLYNASVYKDEAGKVIGIFAAARDITERKKAEEFMANLETARLKEIHHRIKNNLQVISSLLDLQAEKFNNRECLEDSEVLEAFRESQDRVASIALIHEELYEGEGTDTLNFSLYLQKLVENFFQTYRFGNTYNTYISLDMDLEEKVLFDMDTAVPLGIIVNELVSNSFKYAFPGRDRGEIQIKLSREGNGQCENNGIGSKIEVCKSTSYTLTVSDNGVGIPQSVNIKDSDTLGIQLVTILADQLDGELELKRDSGTEFVIRFAVQEKQ